MDIATISPAAAQDVAAEVEAVAERAFAAHPDFDGRAIAAAFAAHAAKPGFVAVATRHDGALAGFAYGFRSFTGEPPSGWYQRVLDAVGSAADHRIRGQFEIPWMAVDPDHQGRGAGRRLLDALLAAAPPRHAWLVTGAGDPAARFYEALGWETLAVDPLGSDRDRIVFGR